MPPVLWRERATERLTEIVEFIAASDPAAALRIETLLLQAAERTASYPYAYRSGRVAGTRELVAHPNYVLVYRVTAKRIEIVNVLHSRQQYPMTR